MTSSFMLDWLLIIGFIVSIGYFFHLLKLPPVIGSLLAGVLLGPHGFALIRNEYGISLLAEMGVILLLFAIGVEFSIRHLLSIRRLVLLGGGLQIVLTAVVIFILGRFAGLAWQQALFFGFLLSLSSTAIVLKLLVQREEMDTPHGKLLLGILIFQDLAIVPLMLLMPLLGSSAGSFLQIAANLGKNTLILGIIYLLGRYAVPRILTTVVHTRNQELVLFTILLLCFATAWGTSQAGLSLALGAFLAGLVVSRSEYSHHILSLVLPLRDSLSTFFFVSIGMMLDLNYIVSSPVLTLGFACVIMVLKIIVAAGVVYFLGHSSRVAVLTGIGLAQVGEFSFILSLEGVHYGLLDTGMQQLFLTGAVITMAFTPVLMQWGRRFTTALNAKGLFSLLDHGRVDLKEGHQDKFANHVIIAGFGINGQNLARVLRQAGIPYVILELNPKTVKRYQEKEEPIFYGDASQRKILELAGIKQARTLVVATSDPVARRHITRMASRLNPSLHIIVRTRYLKDVEELLNLGAHDVVSEELETSFEILARVLHSYFVPRTAIEELITETRSETYTMMRNFSLDHLRFRWETYLSEVQVESYQVAEGSAIEGKSLGEIALRSVYKVTAVAVRRAHETYPAPDANFKLQASDIVVILGEPEKLRKAKRLFS